mmetsp:Transcript_32294/g.58390  ORF Transcript_32294/g.58390 Transcript_32294/m.58390 type:complete len:90 (+) Transcript_32294:1812-2081(+)
MVVTADAAVVEVCYSAEEERYYKRQRQMEDLLFVKMIRVNRGNSGLVTTEAGISVSDLVAAFDVFGTCETVGDGFVDSLRYCRCCPCWC